MCCIACDMREWFVAIYPMGKMVTQVIYAIWSMCQMSIIIEPRGRSAMNVDSSGLIFCTPLYLFPRSVEM